MASPRNGIDTGKAINAIRLDRKQRPYSRHKTHYERAADNCRGNPKLDRQRLFSTFGIARHLRCLPRGLEVGQRKSRLRTGHD